MAILNFSKSYHRFSYILPALKGLAIFLIVIYHIWGYTKSYPLFSQFIAASKNSHIFSRLAEIFLNVFCLLGKEGVHFFLIASGFGLAASWWRSNYTINSEFNSEFNNTSWLNFWQRRLLRLLPMYWLAHFLALIIAWMQPEWVPFGQDILQSGFRAIEAFFFSLTTLRNFVSSYFYFLNPTWWYIGLSVQLYLIFPLLIRIGKRWGWSFLLLASLFISLFYRIFILYFPWGNLGTKELMLGAIFPARLFEFVFGIVLAISILEINNQDIKNIRFWQLNLLFQPSSIVINFILWVIGLICDWAALEGYIILKIPADALIGIGEFCLFFQLLNLVPFLVKILGAIGKYSYGIYLTHLNIFPGLWAISISLIPNYWIRLFFVTFLTCFAGYLFEFGYNWLRVKGSVFKF